MAGATADETAESITHRYNLALPDVYRDHIPAEGALFRHALITLAKCDWASSDDAASAVGELYELPEERSLSALEKGVHKAVDLKYPLRPEDYSLLARALLRGVLSESLDMGLRSKLMRATIRLMSKRECEIPGGIPWRAVADAIMREHVECMHGAPFTGREMRESHCKNLVYLFGKLVFFLPKEDTAEVIWDAFAAKIRDVENDPDNGYLAFMLMSYIMPTRGEQWTGWTKEAMNLFESLEGSPYWDSLWAAMFVRVAKHQPNVVSWDQCIPLLFKHLTLNLGLPLGSAAPHSPLKRYCPRHCYFLANADLVDSVALFSVYALSPLQPTVRTYLDRIIVLMENYCHPSNSGRWSSTIGNFIKDLTRTLVLRVSAERAATKAGVTDRVLSDSLTDAIAPLEHRLDDQYVDGLVNLLLPLIKLGLYSKSRHMSDQAASAARDLAVLSPHLVVAPLLAVAEEGLTYIVSPHRTSTALKVLAGLTPIFLDADIFPDGAQSLPQALQLTLPGIDPNDPSKTRATMHFIAGATARFRDLLDADVIPGLFSFLEDYVPALLDRIFQLFGALEAPPKKTRGMHMRCLSNQVPSFLLTTAMENLFTALPPSIILAAAKRIAREIAGSATTNAMKHYGALVRVSASAAALAGEEKNPAPDIFLSAILGQLLDDSDVQPVLASLSEEELVWRIRMLAQACRCVGPGMEAYLGRLSTVVRLAMERQGRPIYKAGGRLLRGMLEGLTAIRVSYAPGDAKPGLNDDGDQEQDVKWQVPRTVDWKTALDLVGTFFALAESMVYGDVQNAESPKIILNRDVIFRALRLLHAVQRGARWLFGGVTPDHFGELKRFDNVVATDQDIQMTKCEALLLLKRPVRAGLGGEINEEFRRQAVDLWERIYGLVSQILATVLVERPDDGALLYRALEPIELAGEKLKHTSVGRLAGEAFTMFKRAYRPVIASKRPHDAVGGVGRGMPPFVFKRRITGHHQLRLAFAARPGSSNVTLFNAIVSKLAEYSVNDFPRVRAEARGALTRALRVAHPSFRHQTVVNLIDVLSETAKAAAIAERPVIKDSTPVPPVPPSGDTAMVDVKTNATQSSASSTTKKPDIPYEKMMGVASVLRSHAIAPVVMRIMPFYDKIIRVMMESLVVAERPDAAMALGHLYGKLLLYVRPFGFKPIRFVEPDLLTLPAVADTEPVVPVWGERCETYDNLVSFLLGLLRKTDVGAGNSENGVQKQAHWRLQSLVASILYVNLRADRPPSFEVATFFGNGLISDVVSLRQISCKAIVLILALHGKKAEARLEPYTESALPDRPWTGTPNDATRALDELIGGKDFIRKMIHTLALDHEDMESSGNRTQQSKAPGGYQSMMGMVSHYDGYSQWVIFGGAAWPKSRVPRSRDNISVSRVRLYENLFQVFKDKAFEAFVGPTQELIDSVVGEKKGIISGVKDEEVRIIVGEVVAGVCRGVSLDVLQNKDEAIGKATDWVIKILDALTGPLGVVNGGTIIRLVTTSVAGTLGVPVADKVFDWLLAEKPIIAPVETGSVAQVQARRLRYLHSAVADITPQNETRIKRIFAETTAELTGNAGFAHELKAVREEVGRCLALSATFNESDSTFVECIDSIVERLESSRVESGMNMSSDDISRMVDDEEEDENSKETVAKKLRSRLGETLSRLISLIYWTGQTKNFQSYLVKLLPSLFVSLDESDATRVSHARIALSLAAQGCFNAEHLDKVISVAEDATRSPRWRVRGGVLPFVQVLSFMSLFSSDAKYLHRMRTIVVNLISDAQIEVRNAAGVTILPLIRDAPPEAVSEIRETFMAVIAETQPPRSLRRANRKAMAPDVIRRRHGAALGLSSLVVSNPYTVPKWMPAVLVALSNCISDPPPISTSVKTLFADFMRTHRDEWAEHKAAFTEEELEIVSELLVSPSYYA